MSPGYAAFASLKYVHDDQGRLRVRVMRAEGTPLPGGFVAADPPKAQAHMNEFGWEEEGFEPYPDEEPGYTNPRITLDSGEIIWGYECWWEPVTAGENDGR